MDAYQWKSLDQYERTEALENRAHTIDNRVKRDSLASALAQPATCDAAASSMWGRANGCKTSIA